MTEEMQKLQDILEVFLVVAAICCTAFPVLWAFSRWWSTTLGRLLMLQSVAFAIAIDFTAVFVFWEPGLDHIMFLFYAQVIIFGLIALSSILLTVTMLKMNYFRHSERKRAHKMDENEQQFPDDEPIVGDAPPKDKVLLSNSVYDKLMPIAQLWLPALAVFYITIAPLWGLPKQEEVAGTIMAVNLFLGAVLGISNKQYQNSDGRFDGAINVETFHDEGYSNLNLQLDPAAVAGKDEVTVKVNRV